MSQILYLGFTNAPTNHSCYGPLHVWSSHYGPPERFLKFIQITFMATQDIRIPYVESERI